MTTTTHYEIRYAERLCQRTARLYRHLSATSTFLSVLGASATLSALLPTNTTVPLIGAALLAAAGALNLAIRPDEKAATADADGKRYSSLKARAHTLSESELQTELHKLREGDTPEVEALRAVVYNDVVNEMGRGDATKKLGPVQWFVGAIA